MSRCGAARQVWRLRGHKNRRDCVRKKRRSRGMDDGMMKALPGRGGGDQVVRSVEDEEGSRVQAR